MNWFDKNKLFEKLLVLSWVVFLFFCLWLLSFTSKAETVAGQLPFLFSNISTYNTWGNENNLGNDILQSIDNYGLPVYDNDYVLILRDIQFYGMEMHSPNMYVIYRAYFYLVPIDTFTTYYDNFMTGTLDFNTLSNDSYYFGVHFDIAGNYFTPIVFNVSTNPNNQSNSMFGNLVREYNNNNQQYPVSFVYTIGAPYYFSRDVFYQNQYVLDYTGGSSNVVHGAVPNIVSQKIPDSNNNPVTKPNPPTINYYTWNTYTPPAIDTTDIESLLESIYNIISYGFSYIVTGLTGEFNNLINNIEDFVNYIVESVEAAINYVIQAINDLSETIYNNFKSLLEPLFEAVEYIKEPLDYTVLGDTFANTSAGSDFGSIKTSFTSFANQFNSISEPSTYKIPIHFENITMFSDVGIQYIDLGWLNSVKSLLRAFLWMVTTYGLIAAIFDAIPNYINGGGDESD